MCSTDGIQRRIGVALGEHLGNHLLAGERGKGQRAHEFLRRFRHHDLHAVAALLQAASNVGGFIGGDAARHSQSNLHVRRYRATEWNPEPRNPGRTTAEPSAPTIGVRGENFSAYLPIQPVEPHSFDARRNADESACGGNEWSTSFDCLCGAQARIRQIQIFGLEQASSPTSPCRPAAPARRCGRAWWNWSRSTGWRRFVIDGRAGRPPEYSDSCCQTRDRVPLLPPEITQSSSAPTCQLRACRGPLPKTFQYGPQTRPDTFQPAAFRQLHQLLLVGPLRLSAGRAQPLGENDGP